jgi:hypothetical protein
MTTREADYRGFLIQGSSLHGYAIRKFIGGEWRIVGEGYNMRNAKFWVDKAIKEGWEFEPKETATPG